MKLVGLLSFLAASLACGSEPEGRVTRPAASTNVTSEPTATSAGSGARVGAALPGVGNGFGGFPALANAPQGGTGEPPLADGTCATGAADTIPVIPTIWLVVDGSTSMTAEFGTSDGWDTLRATLLDQGAIVQTLQPIAKFGMVIYAGGGLGVESAYNS